MNSLLVIAMIALVGFSITSAAAIDLDDHETPDSMEDFKESLQSLVHEVAEQIKENADYDENMDFETFLRVNKFDDEEASIVHEEDGEFADNEVSAVEDDQSNENVDSGMTCAWRGRFGHCCQSLRILRHRFTVCLRARIVSSCRMRIVLSLNRYAVWRHTLITRHRYRGCVRRGCLHLCIFIYRLSISRHSAQGCLSMAGYIHRRRFHSRIGCFFTHYADADILTARKTPIEKMQSEQSDYVDFFVKPKMEKQGDDVLRFHQ